MAADVGQKAPDFTLVNTDLKAVDLKDFAGKNVNEGQSFWLDTTFAF